jgi:hypothetical protein
MDKINLIFNQEGISRNELLNLLFDSTLSSDLKVLMISISILGPLENDPEPTDTFWKLFSQVCPNLTSIERIEVLDATKEYLKKYKKQPLESKWEKDGKRNQTEI